jgi:hypothetical protein
MKMSTRRLFPCSHRPYAHVVRELPFVDEHRVHVRAPLPRTHDVVSQLAHRLADRHAPRPFVTAWRLEPASGFAITSSTSERIVLAGHHRFARYELAFELHPTNDGVEVCARTSAEFHGTTGRLYRALVIGSGGHGVAVRAMLRKIWQTAQNRSPSGSSSRRMTDECPSRARVS